MIRRAVVHCCPLAAVREIYKKITLLLLNGSLLRLDETGDEAVNGWAGISASLIDSQKNRNPEEFAAAFRRLADDYYAAIRLTLIEIGIESAKEMPVLFSERQDERMGCAYKRIIK